MDSGQPGLLEGILPPAEGLNEAIFGVPSDPNKSVIPWSRFFFINIFYTLAGDADAHPSD